MPCLECIPNNQVSPYRQHPRCRQWQPDRFWRPAVLASLAPSPLVDLSLGPAAGHQITAQPVKSLPIAIQEGQGGEQRRTRRKQQQRECAASCQHCCSCCGAAHRTPTRFVCVAGIDCNLMLSVGNGSSAYLPLGVFSRCAGKAGRQRGKRPVCPDTCCGDPRRTWGASPCSSLSLPDNSTSCPSRRTAPVPVPSTSIWHQRALVLRESPQLRQPAAQVLPGLAGHMAAADPQHCWLTPAGARAGCHDSTQDPAEPARQTSAQMQVWCSSSSR